MSGSDGAKGSAWPTQVVVESVVITLTMGLSWSWSECTSQPTWADAPSSSAEIHGNEEVGLEVDGMPRRFCNARATARGNDLEASLASPP